MVIKKAVIEVVVLFDDVHVSPMYFNEASLADIEAEMNDGAFIGQSSVESIEEVPPEKLEEELLALGNDGTYFPLNTSPSP